MKQLAIAVSMMLYASGIGIAQQTGTDNSALNSFFNAMNGQSWTFHNNWTFGDISTWYGVTASSGRVTELRLRENNLEGSLPSQLWTCTELAMLHLRGNHITGTIPSGIGNLTKLKFIALCYNTMSGPIPTEVGSLTNLSELYFQNCSFSGTLPASMGNLTDLQYIVLSNNQLEGTPPAGLNNLSKLKHLLLSSNQFTGMPNIAALSSTLELLKVDNNLLDFGDLEPLWGIATTFVYAPQGLIGTEKSESVDIGNAFSYTLNTGGTHNTYQWYKNGYLIQGATSATISIQYVTNSDAGDYTCKVNNTLLTDLTLTSRPVHLQIGSGGGGGGNINTWHIDVVSDAIGTWNEIVWDGDNSDFHVVEINKEGNHAGEFNNIGEIDLLFDPPPYRFRDVYSTPIVHADNYKIRLIIHAYPEVEVSDIQRAVHLTINQGMRGSINLIWTPYVGLPVDQYEIKGGATANVTSMVTLAMLSGSLTSYTDLAGYNYYVIETHFASEAGMKSGDGRVSYSNIATNEDIVPGGDRTEIMIYPNPADQVTTSHFVNSSGEPYQLRILDLNGRVMMDKRDVTDSDIELRTGELPPGIYLVEAVGDVVRFGKIVIAR